MEEHTPLVGTPPPLLHRPMKVYIWTLPFWKYFLISIFVTGLVVAGVVVAVMMSARDNDGEVKMYCYEYYDCTLEGCSSYSSDDFQFPTSNSDYIYYSHDDMFECAIQGGMNCNYTWNDCVSATKSEKKIKFCSQKKNDTDLFYYAWCFNVPKALMHQSRYCKDDADYKRPEGVMSCS